MNTRVLTGITTTGTPHLGNYVGAIRPAVRSAEDPTVDAFFFLADYHALIKCEDPARIARSRLEIAATWLAAGLDPEHTHFYRQSDIPEIPELSWMLTCVTGKGLMNRAHAYKAAVDANRDKGEEEDDGVTMGLFSYPILMAADILMFNAHKVPVGRDQVQHLEMARDIAARFNHLYGEGRPWFVLPEAVVDDEVATLTGLDGRKMSKSYNNTIPLFEGGAKAIKGAVARIVTDSLEPGQPKDPFTSNLLPIYQAFATPSQTQDYIKALQDGLGWGEAKTQLIQVIESQIAPMRDQYEMLMAKPDDIEDILLAGANKARAIATPFMEQLRAAVGLGKGAFGSAGKEGKSKRKIPKLVQFKDEAGQFRFRLLDSSGQTLFVSLPQSDPKEAGMLIGKIKSHPSEISVVAHETDGYQLVLQGQTVAIAEVGLTSQELTQRMQKINSALQELGD
ncbi:tryptophan--tRNA ligase [Orrella daihaiensis]|uniref:Tryptophan--tRNA ligase n=1 Tax=Orrella daihaiensis TaxID=2782176 RepID=A0ABY4AH75_9BURK|nr:tryptophan--tRNA ligase [Orrella daihaiensis]UOD49641.1 tryptophan--tRNA ligase [Orrella daihaiensis]